MIRKAVLVALTLGAVGTVVLMTRSVFSPVPSLDCYDWQDCRIVYFGGIDLHSGAPHLLVVHLFPGRVWIDLGMIMTSGIIIPLWIPFVIFAAYAVLAFIRGPLRRWRRRRKGLCLNCGYNLEGGVCPECGEAI